MPEKDRLLTKAIRDQANKRKHRRYGYRRIIDILCVLGWSVNHKRVYRIWRWEELRLPQKCQKRKCHNGNGLNACDVGLSTKQHDVIELLRYLFLVRGCPACIRSDNGSEFTTGRTAAWAI